MSVFEGSGYFDLKLCRRRFQPNCGHMAARPKKVILGVIRDLRFFGSGGGEVKVERSVVFGRSTASFQQRLRSM